MIAIYLGMVRWIELKLVVGEAVSRMKEDELERGE
jgi:hypothetical protein